ncbi:TetR-like C-terminal domain-containing protein [Patulibacter sp.]|uniref:TetR-like C-terminal domain-containing protein n=1 Tax=Patulibacter sp. TaxID=1912859 RepID=UPI00271F6654|nr:TetR/AcrR family transcriptional regulator [Patulibacter sp.]MDO9407615.1 TetR/AcrR family transcriptional regulator [Patulibacter sp.]
MAPPRPRPGLDAERVTDAAVAIADADGFDALSLARLAAELGVRTPSLYHHVAGLDGARRAVALRGLRGLGTALRTAAVGRSGPDAVRELARAYRTWAVAHPGAYAATQRTDLAKDDELRAAFARAVEVVFAVLRHWEQDEERLVHLVRAVRSALHGFVLLESGRGFGMDASLDVSFDLLVAFQLAGLDAHAAARR